jgi:hypothetical protein
MVKGSSSDDAACGSPVGLARFLGRLKETEHLRRWPQKKVAKIVRCGEALAEKNRTSLVSSDDCETYIWFHISCLR